MDDITAQDTPSHKRNCEGKDFVAPDPKRVKMQQNPAGAADGFEGPASQNAPEIPKTSVGDWNALASANLAKFQEPKTRAGEAPIKTEFRVVDDSQWTVNQSSYRRNDQHVDDDEAEGSTFTQSGSKSVQASFKKGGGKDRDKKNERGQNKNRQFGSWGDKILLCNSRAFRPEFSPGNCRFGDNCRLEHDLRKYLSKGKAEDLTTFNGKCPIWDTRGFCTSGWKCRFVGSHSTERETEGGKKELVLLEDEARKAAAGVEDASVPAHADEHVLNFVSLEAKINLSKRKTKTPRADEYIKWLSDDWGHVLRKKHQPVDKQDRHHATKESGEAPKSEARGATENGDGSSTGTASNAKKDGESKGGDGSLSTDTPGDSLKSAGTGDIAHPLMDKDQKDGADIETVTQTNECNVQPQHGNASKTKGAESGNDITTSEKRDKEDHRAEYVEPPFLPSEKRRLYYGPDTPVLAPLTTQGNLPFRRLCVELGAQVTFSEMAMSMPLLQGEKGEWALMKCHSSETTPPIVKNADAIPGYTNSRDLKFGVQISANKPWIALKTAEILPAHIPYVRAIDLNCGCPIDLVYQTGAGSALLDAPSKLEKMLRGMNALSGEIPITAKIRTGTRDREPNADKIVNRLLLGGRDSQQAGLGPPGVAAITLHGRSRQQRYSRAADWSYIADIAALLNRIQKEYDQRSDTLAEPEARNLPNGGKTYFLGNGDCYSHIDYAAHITDAGVDSVMIGRGALVKPWLFEEIATGQYLDKTASERLGYIERFARYGLECWGSDEAGVGTTRRFLLEWLSFSCRYVPIGLLERLPPQLNERPPRYRGRNELETLLASKDYRDWIKITEMFLGPAHKDFRFTPKHKSNSYDNTDFDAEG